MKRLAATLLLLASCGPPGADLPGGVDQEYLVYDYDSDRDDYVLRPATIATLTNPRAVDGEVAFVRGGGKLVANTQEPSTEQEFADQMRVEGDHEPRAEFHVDETGTAVPWDFDTQMMISTYHHLERATDYFESIGFDAERVGRMPVYYFPQLAVLGVAIPVFSDNAAYAFGLDAFIIPPKLVLEDVPLAANRGVIIHEYSHAVFNRIVHRDSRAPRYLVDSYDPFISEQIRSLDEGLADTFAALATQDPNFIGPSISEELFDIDRNLTEVRIYDEALLGQIVRDLERGEGNPYLLGSVIASTLWALRGTVDDVTLGTAILGAMAAIATPGPSFTIEAFFDAFLAEIPDQKTQACDLFVVRLEAIADDLDCE